MAKKFEQVLKKPGDHRQGFSITDLLKEVTSLDKQAHPSFFQNRTSVSEVVKVSLNHRQDVGHGHGNEEGGQPFCIGQFTAFQIVAAGFQIAIEGFDEHPIMIDDWKRSGFCQIGDQGERFGTIVAPIEKQMGMKAGGGDPGLHEEIIRVRLTVGQERADRRGGDICTADPV